MHACLIGLADIYFILFSLFLRMHAIFFVDNDDDVDVDVRFPMVTTMVTMLMNYNPVVLDLLLVVLKK